MHRSCGKHQHKIAIHKTSFITEFYGNLPLQAARTYDKFNGMVPFFRYQGGKKRKTLLLVLTFGTLATVHLPRGSLTFAQETTPARSPNATEENGGFYAFLGKDLAALLEGYLRNNLEVQTLSGAMEREFLEHNITELSNGFRFKLATGTATFTMGSAGSITFKPSASLAVPQVANMTLSVSADIHIDDNDATDTLSNLSFSVGADILSASGKKRALSLLRAERDVLVAQRNLQNGFVKAETQFFEELKSLYNLASDVIKAEQELYDDQLSFDQIKAQGYRTTSSRYRTAQMQVLSDQHTVQSKRRELEREARIFASNCGTTYEAEDPFDFLPSEIPEVELLKVSDFDREAYTKIENAQWTQKVNTLSREAETALTLTGSAGYTINNSLTKSDSVDAGAALTWNDTGLTVSAGASLPVGADSFAPVYTLGVSIDPLAFTLAKLNTRIEAIDASQEELAVQDAEQDYKTAVISQRSSRANLLWQKQTYDETYTLYEELEADMARYLRQGIISESEYRSSLVNKESARIKCLVTRLDMIVYNNETMLLFYRDEELRAPRAPKEAEDE